MKNVASINATHNDNILYRDYSYTIKYLLNGGYFGNNDFKLSRLTMTAENLSLRINEYLKAIKKMTRLNWIDARTKFRLGKNVFILVNNEYLQLTEAEYWNRHTHGFLFATREFRKKNKIKKCFFYEKSN